VSKGVVSVGKPETMQLALAAKMPQLHSLSGIVSETACLLQLQNQVQLEELGQR
jgi:hypothetical protein